MGEGKERSETERDAEETDDVARRSEQDRRSTTSKMGEGQGTKESSLIVATPTARQCPSTKKTCLNPSHLNGR
jgi:hypothetical protein